MRPGSNMFTGEVGCKSSLVDDWGRAVLIGRIDQGYAWLHDRGSETETADLRGLDLYGRQTTA